MSLRNNIATLMILLGSIITLVFGSILETPLNYIMMVSASLSIWGFNLWKCDKK